MSSRLPRLTPDALDAAQRTLYDAIAAGPRAQGAQHFDLTAADGSLRGPFNAMLFSPALGTALQEVGAAVRYRTSLSDRARELAILLVATRWNSAFERESHEAIGRAVGLTDSEIAATRNSDAAPFSGIEHTVARTVLALLDGDLDDAAWAAASRDLGTAAVVELTTLVGYYSTLALQLRVFRV
ncbi:carboxymuconolactone decarboxylase family protein [Microbacterium protaetiae]|uniref:Carboxymuconolactone decarboxylase family protein n=2 Tax=Microbacterium protaetiae TaxID=2509458 RepID=A0A4P6EH56_9MICO|nr:carboxymuconolactone decarboxylase family protein [Microbacterium protaetiae]